MVRNLSCLLSAALLLVVGVSTATAVPIMIDTFDDGTTMGWFVPGTSPNPPAHVGTGGPGGLGDGYLQLTATGGSGAGGRLSVLNSTQWTGNFRAAGITSIEMDVFNFGSNDLTLRLLFEDFAGPGPPVNLAITLDDIFVPAGSGWTAVAFDLSASNLASLIGVGDALASVDVLRIIHNPDATFGGPSVGVPPVNATLGVDNIVAVTGTVPEPATGALLLLGAAAALRWRRRH